MKNNRKVVKFLLAMIMIVSICINNVFAETLLNTKIEIVNHKLSGISIFKTNTLGQNLEGIKFRVTNKDTAGLVGEYTTNSEGQISINNLVQGVYKVQEIQTLQGYELDTKTYELNVQFDKTNTELKLVNQFLGNIKVIVKDSKTKNLLKDAKINITNVSTGEVKEYISNESGEIYIEKTQTANYTIEQKEAPKYYQKDNNKYTIAVVPENTTIQEIENAPYSDLHIYSLDNYNDSPLVNTKFKVTNLDTNEVVGEYTTNENGKIEIGRLYPANYKIEQVDVDSRYDPYSEIQSVKIELAKDPTEIKFYSKKLGGIHLTKKNIDGEAMSEVKFKVLRGDKTLVGEYTTNRSGEILVEYLPAGDYLVQETKTLNGYYLDPTIYTVTVKNQEKEVVQNNNNSSIFGKIGEIFNF
jgi:uncharacterized surface anchored protein